LLFPPYKVFSMESYQGIKFSVKFKKQYTHPECLFEELNLWAWRLCQLGMTPVHSKGAYGNVSCRDNKFFLISKSGMIPEDTLNCDNFCRILSFDKRSQRFVVEGKHTPSSETIMHYLLYKKNPKIGAILHGHNQLLLSHTDVLGIPVTTEFFPYGTEELAQSAFEMVTLGHRFFQLKDHGFVSVAPDIASAGQLCLQALQDLLRFLRLH